MICMAYLILHAAVWFGLHGLRTAAVKLWCLSGLTSGVAVVLLSSKGNVPEFWVYYVGPALMAFGNAGRQVALRLHLDKPQRLPFAAYALLNLAYLGVSFTLSAQGRSDSVQATFFYLFYALICFDYARIGWQLDRQRSSFGARLVMHAGLILSSTLGVKAAFMALGLGSPDFYGEGIDQYLMILGQFLAITLMNIGFLRLNLEIAEGKKVELAEEMATLRERGQALTRSQVVLTDLLREREEIIRQLMLSNKTAGMGALVASLAHELNQPLAVIQVNAEMLTELMREKLVGDDSSVEKKVELTIDGLIQGNARAAEIVRTLRRLFAGGPVDAAPVDLRMLVQDALAIVGPRVEQHRIALALDLHDTPSLMGNSGQLQQVVVNLLNNAIDALQTGVPKPRILLRTQQQNGALILRISDNGPGVDDTQKDSIFELFKTSKSAGMGVGLWLSQAIIRRHGGCITMDPSSGAPEAPGACFCVSLPLDPQPA